MAAKVPPCMFPVWPRALDAEIGIRFTVSGASREVFRNHLYEARKQLGDPRLQELIMFLPAAPHDNEIWICKKSVELSD